MSRTPTRSVVTTLISYSVAASRLSRLNCRSCRTPLDIHQPNPNQPDQFLGTCPECGTWFRIEVKADQDKATVVQLPEMREIEATYPSTGHSA